jgi:hypothetical protein
MRHIASLVPAVALLSACTGDPTATRDAGDHSANASVTGTHPESDVQQDLARLRQVTVSFHEFETAKHAGWDSKITSCMTDPVAGGMGFHYGKTKLIDGNVSVEEPELLLYEPQKNGRLQLVAVEYIVPLTASATPPRLFNRDFKVNAAFGIWALHAWVWKENPSGMFADWNPKVNCEHTTDIAAMARH